MRTTMLAIALVIVLSLSMWAQQRQNQAPPLQGGVITAADFAAIVAKQPKDRNGNATFLQLAPYNVNMEHRVNMPQNASIHDKEAELFYVIDGSAMLVTGGKLKNETRQNAANLSGSGIEGGVSRHVSKGDFIMVPEGTPHWFSSIDGTVVLMSLHLPRAPKTASAAH